MPDYEDELFSYELRNELEDALEADPPDEEETARLTAKGNNGVEGTEEFTAREIWRDCNLWAAAEAGHLMAQKITAGWSAERRQMVTLFIQEAEKMRAEKEKGNQEGEAA